MLYIIGFQDKETSYVWDTDDFTIEKISNYDIAKAQVGGVHIENLPTLSLRALLDIKEKRNEIILFIRNFLVQHKSVR